MGNQKTAMDFDTFDTDVWAEINDMPGEIYDIEEEKFDVQEYINGNITQNPMADKNPNLEMLMARETNPQGWFRLHWSHPMLCDAVYDMNRQELQEQLIDNVIEGMDFKTMWQVLYDFMDQSYDKYTDEELMEEVKEYYPELLEEN